ncbi:peptidylprolyl isomerase [Roseovarius sp. EL26]|uniref:peptidylprolyl isomerase n=1 Tax=Roseovarius sp. EL26 TaxID=2126672 RepID=UPI000EA2262B|nr:peptidylprolyl isomerase [Roseovarius sp. EL26]
MRKLAVLFALMASPALATGLQIDVSGKANGTIKIDLLEDVAPKHVERITALAREGAYDGVAFHRVISGFMAQTGDVEFGRVGSGNLGYAGTGGSDRPDLKSEFSDQPFVRGTLGMARSSSPHSANSQFFIMFQSAPHLDGQYTVVGQVTEGMEVVDKIKRGSGQSGSVSGKPDVMTKVTVTD